MALRRRWPVVLLLLLVLLCAASRCSGSRWANPESGIPPHPSGTPAVGYISPESPPDPDADADVSVTDGGEGGRTPSDGDGPADTVVSPDENPY